MVLALLLACLAALGPSMVPDEVEEARTSDGWTLPLRRYVAPGPPVLLVHGMAANHRNFDHRPEVGLAASLQAAGFDVWVASLRGDPGTIPPARRARRRIGFDDHARLDAPALLDAVQRATGAPRVAWVGHSMGGMLLYSTLAQWPERIAAGVAVGAPVRFDDASGLQRAVALAVRAAPPTGRYRKGWAYLALLPGLRRWILPVLLQPEHLPPPMVRGLLGAAASDLPRQVARDIARWRRAGALVDRRGRAWLRPADVPVLAIAGSADRVAPPSQVAPACEVLPRCRYEVAGGAQGAAFGHVDLLVSEAARRLVHPRVAAFLRQPDPGAPRPALTGRAGSPPGSRSP